MYPHELTYGVFDAATLEQPLPNPILWVWQVHAKAAKVFASLIDGGSALNSKANETRYLLRSMAPRPDVVVGDETLQRGDVVQLLDYTWRRVAGKSEIIFVILKLAIRSREYSNQIDNIPRQNLLPYPHDHATSMLATAGTDSRGSCSTVDETREAVDAPPIGRPAAHTAEGPPRTPLSSPLDGFNGVRSRPLYPNLDSPPNDETSSDPPVSSTFTKEPPMELRRQPCDGVSSYATPNTTGSGPVPMEGRSTTVRSAPYPPQYRQSGPIARRVDGQFIEIKNLTSFLGRWVVKGRFINKGEPRTYSNQRGEGKLWSCELVDSPDEGGTIRCTFFNKAVDKFYSLITENHVYIVSRGTLKPANRKFNSGAHPFELQLGEDAEIQWVASDDPTIPTKPPVTVVPISDVASLPKQTSVSICGIVMQISEISEINTRSTGQPRAKRELSILDDSNVSIDVTLWGNKTSLLDGIYASDHPVVLIEHARVDEYNGRKLSSVAQTQIQVNPECPEARRIAQWFLKQERSSYTSLTNASWANETRPAERVTIAELRQRALDAPESELEDRGRWFSCQATLVTIDRDRQFYWVACPGCGKKVLPSNSLELGVNAPDPLAPYDASSEVYVCPSCTKQVETPVRKYLLNLEIADVTGSLRCTAMGDRGHLIMGPVTADTLAQLQAAGYDPSVHQRYEDFFLQRLRREYVFKIQAKSETYRDETRVRYRVFGLDPINAVIATDAPQGPNGIATCRATLIKEAKRALDTIYAWIPRHSLTL